MAGIERTSAKVLLVTPSLEVLLFSSLDPGHPLRPRHWFAVGGGVEDGETLEQAAIREVREETGLELLEVGEPVLSRLPCRRAPFRSATQSSDRRRGPDPYGERGGLGDVDRP